MARKKKTQATVKRRRLPPIEPEPTVGKKAPSLWTITEDSLAMDCYLAGFATIETRHQLFKAFGYDRPVQTISSRLGVLRTRDGIKLRPRKANMLTKATIKKYGLKWPRPMLKLVDPSVLEIKLNDIRMGRKSGFDVTNYDNGLATVKIPAAKKQVPEQATIRKQPKEMLKLVVLFSQVKLNANVIGRFIDHCLDHRLSMLDAEQLVNQIDDSL